MPYGLTNTIVQFSRNSSMKYYIDLLNLYVIFYTDNIFI